MSEPRVSLAHHGGANHGVNGNVSIVILHDEEFPLDATSAEHIARFFADPHHGVGCAHYVIDADSEHHCVPEGQKANHAPPNGRSVGIERDGYASWDLTKWNAPQAQRTTCNVAARTAELLVRHGLPITWVTAAGQKAGQQGVSDHRSRSAAFGQSTHSDPGAAFPREAFMALVLTATCWVRDAASFQRAHGLTPDGDVGPETVLAMGAALAGGAPAGTPPVPGNSSTPPQQYTPEPASGILAQWMKGPRVAAVQKALGLTADGFFGIDTCAAVRQFQACHGLAVDGLVGPATLAALTQPPAAPPAPAHAALTVDGEFGPNTIRRLQQVLGVSMDGQYGPDTKRALQRLLGVRDDGVIGPMTIRALQRTVGAGVDGTWGPDTVRHLQTWLNGHS